jgi:hypothetical protein
MAIVRQDAESAGIGDSTASVDWGFSRRRFLVGAGVTLATTSVLGPWLKKATASTSHASLPDGFTTGVSDAFEELAQDGELALRTFDELVAAHARSIRFAVEWDRVEMKPGHFDWSHYDDLYRALVFHGLKAHPALIGCPDWVGEDERKRATNGIYYPVGSRALNGYGCFAVETLRHFTAFGDQIDAVEVWSEPNNPSGAYIADPAEFSRMLSTVSLFVDCANADGTFKRTGAGDMTVLSGGLYLTDEDRSWERYLAGFQEQLFPYQLALHTPASSTRGVANGTEYAERNAESIGALVDRAVAQSGREVWVTGTGAVAQPPWGEQGQALALGSVAAALAERSACRAMMITGLRAGNSPDATAIETPLPMSGVLRSDGAPTPALATLQTAWAAP